MGPFGALRDMSLRASAPGARERPVRFGGTRATHGAGSTLQRDQAMKHPVGLATAIEDAEANKIMTRTRGTKHRTQRTAAQWQELIERFERTEQSRGGFCTAHGLAPSTFDLWRRKLRATAAAVPPPLPGSEMHRDDRIMSALGPVIDRPVSIPIPMRARRSVGYFFRFSAAWVRTPDSLSRPKTRSRAPDIAVRSRCLSVDRGVVAETGKRKKQCKRDRLQVFRSPRSDKHPMNAVQVKPLVWNGNLHSSRKSFERRQWSC